MDKHLKSSFALGVWIFLGLTLGSWLLAESAIRFKEYERVVSVKGLAEREVAADVAVWPIRFSVAANQLDQLYADLELQTRAVNNFLYRAGFSQSEVTASAPIVNDRLAQQYGNQDVRLRYSALQVITVYTNNIEGVRRAQSEIVDLGKTGIVFGGDEYSDRVTYMFTGLNDLKPAMIEEATRAAREAAEQFAKDSNSRLGKLKTARQGQFSIEDRDSNTPHLKKVRVVSTVDYYLSD
ncbi:MAG: SIMPL domain-containing protein [Cellvibrio sp.]